MIPMGIKYVSVPTLCNYVTNISTRNNFEIVETCMISIFHNNADKGMLHLCACYIYMCLSVCQYECMCVFVSLFVVCAYLFVGELD